MINTEQANTATTLVGSGRFQCLCFEVYCFSNYNNERCCDADPSSQTAQRWRDNTAHSKYSGTDDSREKTQGTRL